MNMKKIAILALSLCMIAAIAVTGTIAYFTDTDSQENVFVTGNVAIDLWEDFGDNDDETIEKLMPTTYDENGDEVNAIEKEIYVTNTGSENAYVRVFVAIPQALDSGIEDDPKFTAIDNILHWNSTSESMSADGWNWHDAYNKQNSNTKYPGWPGNAGDWNSYVETIDNVNYNVYVGTYMSELEPEATTMDAVSQVYLDKDTTNEMITAICSEIGDEWKILVAAQATQVEGFDDPYTALNTSFGVPAAGMITNWNEKAGDKIFDEGTNSKGN